MSDRLQQSTRHPTCVVMVWVPYKSEAAGHGSIKVSGYRMRFWFSGPYLGCPIPAPVHVWSQTVPYIRLAVITQLFFYRITSYKKKNNKHLWTAVAVRCMHLNQSSVGLHDGSSYARSTRRQKTPSESAFLIQRKYGHSVNGRAFLNTLAGSRKPAPELIKCNISHRSSKASNPRYRLTTATTSPIPRRDEALTSRLPDPVVPCLYTLLVRVRARVNARRSQIWALGHP